MKNFAAPRGLVRESVGITVGSTVPDFFTVEEAAAILRIGRTAAYALAREYLATDGASGLPVVQLGKLLRVPRTRLEAMIGGPITWPLKGTTSWTSYRSVIGPMWSSWEGPEPVPHTAALIDELVASATTWVNQTSL
jgi:Helix-turn-helix domain